MNHVGEEIRNKRKQLHLTQAEVAGEFMSISKLSNIENGKILPGPQAWVYLSKKLGLGERVENRKQSVEKVIFLLEQAATYETASLNEKAGNKYHEAAELALRLMLLSEAGRAYRKLGSIHIKKKRYKQARECLNQAQKCLEETDEWEQSVICELEFAVLFYREDKYRLSLESAKRALEWIPIGEVKMQGAVHYNLAAAYYRMEKLDLANLECERSLSYLVEEDGDYYIAALILHGILLKKIHMYLLSRKKHEKAKECATKQRKSYYMGMCWHNLGDVSMEEGDFDQALNFFRLSLEVKEQSGDQLGIIRTKNYLAELYYRMGNLDVAQETVQEALKLSRQHRLRTDEFLSVRILGKIHAKLGNESQFLDSAFKAMTIADDLAFHKEKIALLEQIAEHYDRLGDHERCLEKLYQAFLIKSREINGGTEVVQ